MSDSVSLNRVPRSVDAAVTESRPVRIILIALTLLFLTAFLVVPLAAVFDLAFSKGVGYYLAALADPDAVSAIRLTLLVAAIAVPLNVVFGLAASWAIAKFEFRGKSLLMTLIDLPFGIAGDCRPGICVDVRRARLVRALARSA